MIGNSVDFAKTHILIIILCVMWKIGAAGPKSPGSAYRSIPDIFVDMHYRKIGKCNCHNITLFGKVGLVLRGIINIPIGIL